jgi:hypothetical protein
MGVLLAEENSATADARRTVFFITGSFDYFYVYIDQLF